MRHRFLKFSHFDESGRHSDLEVGDAFVGDRSGLKVLRLVPGGDAPEVLLLGLLDGLRVEVQDLGSPVTIGQLQEEWRRGAGVGGLLAKSTVTVEEEPFAVPGQVDQELRELGIRNAEIPKGVHVVVVHVVRVPADPRGQKFLELTKIGIGALLGSELAVPKLLWRDGVLGEELAHDERRK